eukprot:gene6391-12929_t
MTTTQDPQTVPSSPLPSYLWKEIVIKLKVVVDVECKLKGRNDYETTGVLLLDSITFPKLIPNDKYNMIVGFFLKSDIGTSNKNDDIRDEYLEFTREGSRKGEMEDIICAQVIVNGGENKALADRNGASQSLPKIVLYTKNDSLPIVFDEKDVNFLTLTSFVSKHTGFYIRRPGNIEIYDKLANKFCTAKEDERQSILNEAEDALSSVSPIETIHAEYYIKVMKKTMENEHGNGYITEEFERLRAIVESDKVSKSKANELMKKLNILAHFQEFIARVTPPKVTTEKSEL